jgi:hypothetical protein
MERILHHRTTFKHFPELKKKKSQESSKRKNPSAFHLFVKYIKKFKNNKKKKFKELEIRVLDPIS